MSEPSAFDELSPLERQQVKTDADCALTEIFRAAHEATGWCGDILPEAYKAALPILHDFFACYVIASRKSAPQTQSEER